MEDSGKWEVVNTKQKKQQKEQSRDERRKKEKEAQRSAEEAEKQRKAKELDKFFTQYVQAKTVVTSDVFQETMFSALSQVDEKSASNAKTKERSRKQLPDEPFEGEVVQFVNTKQKKQHGQKQKQGSRNSNNKKSSLQEEAQKIDPNVLRGLLHEWAAKYPNNYDVQLKVLVDHFETLFNQTTAEPISFSNKDYLSKLDIPLEYLSKEVVEVIRAWIAKMPDEEVSPFLFFLITNTIQRPNVTKGFGLLLLIQVMVRSNPAALAKSATQIKEQYTQKQLLVPSVTPFLAWVFAQAIPVQPFTALSLWFQFLLPLLFDASRTDSHDVAISFVTATAQTKNKGQMDEGSAVMGYERLLMLKTSGKAMPARLAEVVESLLSISSKNSNTPQLFSSSYLPKRLFSMLLGHAASEKESLRVFVLTRLVDCLEANSACFSYWKEIYSKYVAQSNNLLLFIMLGWENKNLSRKLAADDMLEIIHSFLQTNKDLKGQADKDKKSKKNKSTEDIKEIDMCSATCKALRAKLKPYSSQKKGDLVTLCSTLLPLTLIAAGGVIYTLSNCCDLDWCRSNSVLNDFLHCGQ